MTNIPLEDLLRFERGELDEERALRVEGALASDPVAAEWLAWIRALRAGAPGFTAEQDTAPGAASIADIALLAAGSLDSSRAAQVRKRLLATPDGFDLLESALEEASLVPDQQAPEPSGAQAPILSGPRPAPRRSRMGIPSAAWGGLAAALLVAAGLWWWQRPHASPVDPALPGVASLAERTPMAVPRLRGGKFDAGLEAYGRMEFQAAVSLLREATKEDPEAGTIWLYLGSAELLLGNLDRAADAFEIAQVKCEPSYQVEATWQLAQTRLAQDRPDSATELLRQLEGTRRGTAASELLQALAQPSSGTNGLPEVAPRRR